MPNLLYNVGLKIVCKDDAAGDDCRFDIDIRVADVQNVNPAGQLAELMCCRASTVMSSSTASGRDNGIDPVADGLHRRLLPSRVRGRVDHGSAWHRKPPRRRCRRRAPACIVPSRGQVSVRRCWVGGCWRPRNLYCTYHERGDPNFFPLNSGRATTDVKEEGGRGRARR